MKQAITTKYLPYTNTKPSRVKATTSSGISLTMSYDLELSADGNHTAVAKALAEKLGWKGTWIGGGFSNGNSYVGLPTGSYIATHDGRGMASEDWFNVL